MLINSNWVIFSIVFLLGVSAVASNSQPMDNTDKKFSLKIVPSSNEPESGPYINIHRQMNVVITNKTESDLAVWAENCSWGYRCLSFKILFGDDEFTVVQKGQNWTVNGPSAFVVKPQDHFVSNVRFIDEKWQGLPQKWDSQKVRIKAIFQIKPDDESRKLGVWNGKMESDWLEVNLHKRKH